jgi:hypothetical protein
MSRINSNNPVNNNPAAQFKQQKPEGLRELVYLSEQANKTAGDAFEPAQAYFSRPSQTLAESGHSATRTPSKTASKLLPKIDSASSSPFEAISDTFEAWFQR